MSRNLLIDWERGGVARNGFKKHNVEDMHVCCAVFNQTMSTGSSVNICGMVIGFFVRSFP